jgi:hypothetical protein
MPDRYAYLKMGIDVNAYCLGIKIDAADYAVWDRTANFNKTILNSKNRIQIMHNSN